MAIFHYSARIISRKKGQSSVAAAAYRSGSRLQDERTGEIHNYTKKGGIDAAEILRPAAAPTWTADRAVLWNRVEAAEKRKDAQLAREVIVALPQELNRSEQVQLTRSFVQEHFVSKGMVADVAWHRLDAKNPHAHILLTTRSLTQDGFGPKQREWNKKEHLQEQRKGWADAINAELARKGLSERVTHESLKAQGIQRAPQKHLGKHANAFERKGIATKVGDYNRSIETQYQRYQKQQRRDQQQKQFNRKMAFLYATHQISRQTYLKYTQGKGLPKTKYGILWAEATGQISKKHADYLRSQLDRQQRQQEQERQRQETAQEQARKQQQKRSSSQSRQNRDKGKGKDKGQHER